MTKAALSDVLCRSFKLPKGKSSHDLRDANVRGLELRATAGGKAWRFRYTRKSDGGRRQFTFGTFPDTSLSDARAQAGVYRLAVNGGGDPASGVQERKDAPTFQELVEEWQSNHAEANRSKKTQADDQSMLGRYILPTLGSMKARDITRRDLVAMLAKVRTANDGRKGHKPARKLTHRPNRVFELTRAILRWGHEQGAIIVDPTLGMKRPVKKEASRERALSPDEIMTFWANVGLLPCSPGLRLALKLSLITGQRIGEVCGIEKRELTLDGPAPVWVIPRERTKNNEGTRVPLSPLAVELIREALWLQKPVQGADAAEFDSPYLFPARAKRDRSHGPILPGSAAVAMFRGRDKLKVAHFRVHDLRRTTATRMAEMGINPHTISLILNHVSASRSNVTGKVYVQYSYDREKREALDAWGKRLETIVAGHEGSNVVALRL